MRGAYAYLLALREACVKSLHMCDTILFSFSFLSFGFKTFDSIPIVLLFVQVFALWEPYQELDVEPKNKTIRKTT